MRLLSWNIRHGGGRNIVPIIDARLAANPDIPVIGEFRANRNGSYVRDALETAGLRDQRFGSARADLSNVLRGLDARARAVIAVGDPG